MKNVYECRLLQSASKSRQQNLHLQRFICFVQAISYWDFKVKLANNVDLDKVAHLLQIQLFLPLALKVLIDNVKSRILSLQNLHAYDKEVGRPQVL